MSLKIGLPRSLDYYSFYPMWHVFFEELACKVVVSRESNKFILDNGILEAVNDACVPIKLYHGHVIDLKDKVDYLFSPRLVSLDGKETTCPKFLGLLDMVRHSIDGLPPIIDERLDLRNGKFALWKFFKSIGKRLGKSTGKIFLAYLKARRIYSKYQKLLAKNFSPEISWEIIKGEKNHEEEIKERYDKDKKIKLALLGYPYTIYDRYISVDLLHKIKEMGINVLTVENIPMKELLKQKKKFSKEMFWYYSNNTARACLYFLDNKMVDGIIHVTAFGCGPDAMVDKFMELECKNREKVPFKILTGTYLEVLEKGADILVSSGGVGPCRAGYYGTMHEKILNDLGYHPEMIIFEPPLRAPWDFLKKARKLKGNTSWWRTADILKRTWKKLLALDDLEIKANKVRPRQKKPGATSKVLNKAFNYVDEAKTLEEIEEARREGLKELEDVRDYNCSKKPLKVGLIGEIYVVLEPSVNADIEELLGEMGVEVHRSIYLTSWTRDNTIEDGGKNIKETARPYLDQLVGGHGQNSIGETILYAKNGFDGVVHLAPFTCIPEIVSKSIMPRISKDFGIPVLTLFLDEMTGEAGLRTRIEAFVDLMRMKGTKEVETA